MDAVKTDNLPLFKWADHAPGSAVVAAKQTRRESRALIRAMAVSDETIRRRTRDHYRDVILRRPYSLQRDWLKLPEAINVMGAGWCERKLRRLDVIECRLKSLAPSGAWVEAAWNGQAEFPPQEDYCPLSAVAALYGMAAAGELKPRKLTKMFALLFDGVDPVQVMARAFSRMRLSEMRSSYGTGRYDPEMNPVPAPPTRRLTPPLSTGFNDGSEDRYDRMSVTYAVFCPDPPSPSAVAIRRIEEMRGRDQNEIDRKKAKRRVERQKKLAAIRAKHGVDEDESEAGSTADDADDA